MMMSTATWFRRASISVNRPQTYYVASFIWTASHTTNPAAGREWSNFTSPPAQARILGTRANKL